MTSTRRGLFRRGRHDGGASAVEYALILAAVALVGAATLFLLGRTVKGAFVAAQNQTASQPSGVLPSVPTTSTPGPTTTSPAPTTSSPAPTTSSPAPTTSSPAPTTTSPAPTPTTTNATTTTTARRGSDTTILDLSGTVSNTTVSMSPNLGSIAWSGNNIIYSPPNGNGIVGTVVTVTYTYTQGGVNYTGTIRVTITN